MSNFFFSVIRTSILYARMNMIRSGMNILGAKRKKRIRVLDTERWVRGCWVDISVS
jgi:hypothetical protein